jgi:ribosomal protein S18 acetylase RimI-like enzyme
MQEDNLPIRVAGANDRDRLIPLINAAFAAAEPFMTGPRTDPERLTTAMQTGALLLAEDAAGQLSASVYTDVRGERGYVGMLAVDRAHQGSGIGRRMMEAAEDHLRAQGCAAVDISVLSLRPELLPFYRKLGFVETGAEPFHYPHPIAGGQACHCIVMSKKL